MNILAFIILSIGFVMIYRGIGQLWGSFVNDHDWLSHWLWPASIFIIPIALFQVLRDKIALRKEEKRLNHKPSYILAGMIATDLIRQFQELKVKEYENAPYSSKKQIVSFTNKNITVVRSQELDADLAFKPKYEIRLSGKTYPFSEKELHKIHLAMNKALELKEEFLKNQLEVEQQNWALNHIEEYMGIEDVN